MSQFPSQNPVVPLTFGRIKAGGCQCQFYSSYVSMRYFCWVAWPWLRKVGVNHVTVSLEIHVGETVQIRMQVYFPKDFNEPDDDYIGSSSSSLA